MKAATDLVATTTKLTAGMENGHHDFQGRKAGALMVLFDGNTTTIVGNGY